MSVIQSSRDCLSELLRFHIDTRSEIHICTCCINMKVQWQSKDTEAIVRIGTGQDTQGPQALSPFPDLSGFKRKSSSLHYDLTGLRGALCIAFAL